MLARREPVSRACSREQTEWSVAVTRTRGQSLVEFAIFIPVLASLLLMSVDVGRVYLGWVTLTNVARIGANFAAQNPTAWQGSGDATVRRATAR